MATFFGNPLTFPFISWGSLRLGTFLLGRDFSDADFKSSRNSFDEVMYEIFENLKSIFNSNISGWNETSEFINILWSNIYELINRRKGRLKQKWEILKERAVKVKSVLENEDKED